MGAFIELGRGINEVGELSPGIEMPAGAVWQPAFWAYGTARVAGLATDGNRRTIPGGDSAEVMARMDLFANLQLTGTERVHAHFRPLDQRGGFAGRVLSPKESSTTFDIDLDAETLFFEGDVGEMFPNLDPEDRGELDMGFAFGKFPVEFQNGCLVRDEMTAVGLSKTNVQIPGSSGVRVMGLWAFDHVNESNGARDRRDVDLFGLFIEGDFPWGLMELDLAATVSDDRRGDQVNAGVGWTGHSAGNNYSLHANVSQHFNQTVDRARGINNQRTAERPAQGLRRRVGGGRILHRDQSPTRSVLRQWILGVGGFRASGQNGRPQDGENDDDSTAVRVESRMNF